MRIKTSGKILMIGIIAIGLFLTKILWWDKNHPSAEPKTEIAVEQSVDSLTEETQVKKDTVKEVVKTLPVEVKKEVLVAKPKASKKKVVKQNSIKKEEKANESNNVIPNF